MSVPKHEPLNYLPESQPISTNSGSHSNVSDQEHAIWFAMSAPYRRELKAKSFLESLGIECFIPMRYKAVKKRNGTMSRELLPAIHNLIFVHTFRHTAQQIKQDLPYLQWLTRHIDGRNIPITVSDMEMEQFISVTRNYNEHLIYLRPEELDLNKGTPVRILGGPFDGVEGTFMKVKGSRRKRVVVMIKGIVGVAMAEVTPDLLEVLQ